jgi:hypothetical protein
MEIDISSAFFVLCGFFCAYTVSNLKLENNRMLLSVMITLNILVDVWLGTLVSMVLGSLYHLIRGTFTSHDVLLTFLEGMTCLRTLEITKSPRNQSIPIKNAFSQPNFMACHVSSLLFSVDSVHNEQQQAIIFLLSTGRSFTSCSQQYTSHHYYFAFCSFARRHEHCFY